MPELLNIPDEERKKQTPSILGRQRQGGRLQSQTRMYIYTTSKGVMLCILIV